MKKLASLGSFVFFALAATQLLSGCGMDAAQTNKPVMAAAGGETSAETNQYRISQQDILQISVFQINDKLGVRRW
jgi:hypothetical protein